MGLDIFVSYISITQIGSDQLLDYISRFLKKHGNISSILFYDLKIHVTSEYVAALPGWSMFSITITMDVWDGLLIISDCNPFLMKHECVTSL